MKLKTILSTFAIVVLTSLYVNSCTDNSWAKKGGSTTITLPPKTKFVNATWKEDNIWYITRPARADEKPEQYTLQEKSSFGILEGSVIFIEN